MKKVHLDTIPSERLRAQIEADYFKVRHYRVLPFYIMFVFMVVVLLVANNRVHLTSEDASYYINQGSLRTCEFTKFVEIGLPRDFYRWLRGFVQSMYAAGADPSDSMNPAIGFFLARQLRSAATTCRHSGVQLPSNISWHINKLCRDDSLNDKTPYGDPSRLWRPGRSVSISQNSQSGTALSYNSVLFSIDDPPAEFTTQFFLNASWYNISAPSSTALGSVSSPPAIGNISAALAEVDRMEQFHWIDEQTRIVSVDALFFSKSVNRYTRVSLTLEQPSTGSLVKSKYTQTFKILTFGSAAANLSFFVDLVLCLGTFGLIVDLVHLLSTKWGLHRNVKALLGFWEFLCTLLIVLLFVAFVLRMQLWATASLIEPTMYAGYSIDEAMNLMFSQLFLIGSKFSQSYNVLSMSLIPASMKMLMYFQSVRGLNIISRTIHSAVTDIAGLAFISFMLFGLFSAVATVFFGSVAIEFATVSNSFSTLVRMIVAADLDIFDTLLDASPRVTMVFFAMCFFLMWLLILNLIIGILVTAFATAQASGDTTDLESLSEVFRKYFLLKGSFYKEDTRLYSLYHGRARRMSSSVASSSAALRTQMKLGARYQRLSDWQNQRLQGVKRLTELIENGRYEIPFLELPRLMNFMAEEHRNYFYKIVKTKEQNAKQSRTQGELNDEELAFKLVQIQRHLRRLGPDGDTFENGSDSEESLIDETGEDTAVTSIRMGLQRTGKLVPRRPGLRAGSSHSRTLQRLNRRAAGGL